MCHFENIWFENCSMHFKQIVYKWLLDDTFSLFWSRDHVEKFRIYLKKQHKNIKLTSEIEENGSLSFLDMKNMWHQFIVSLNLVAFSTILKDFYQAYTNVDYLKRYFREVLDYSPIVRIFIEIETLKSIFKHNSYPRNFVNRSIKSFLKKLFIQRELICVLLYLGKTSLNLRTRLTRTIEWNLRYCKLKVTFRSNCKLNTLFRFKDSFEKKKRLGIIYRYTFSTTRLLITEKPCVTFAIERLNTRGSLTLLWKTP